jgi:hypothetical protein
MEKSKEIVRRAIEEIYNRNNTTEVDEIYADGYVFHRTTGPEIHSPEGVKELIERRQAVLPNATITIEDQVAEADNLLAASDLSTPVTDASQQELGNTNDTGILLLIALLGAGILTIVC